MKILVLFSTLIAIAAAASIMENLSRTKEALKPIQERKLWEHKEDEALKNDKIFHDSNSDGRSYMGKNKQEDHMKKVETNLHVTASNPMAHVIKPKTDSGMQDSKKTMERENNQPFAPQMHSMWQQMGQFRNSQHKSMRSNDKLHDSHHEHDQDFISFIKSSDEHNQRFHSTNQNIHQESPVGSHGMIPQERYAEMTNAEWDIQNRWHKLRNFGGAYGPSLGYGIPAPSSGSSSSSSATTSGDSGSEAVAVFPNGKAGNCGIPLLLSCSPSVVSGTLITSAYSAPDYRVKKETTGIIN